ncbi:phosphopantetheine-binding protein [Sphingomonas sp. BK580]|uniref:phosphopantetheine-binding protein n=1 Tax=Sphingomonas sp. BK580 TaxID=2586972 RepID=UPI00160D6286|nr:phosphopantetheine-binding protein [Sphingomonas sp. BK580]MBB3693779.1 acyl carrier protein [Sphingomonas sp. BK580]
MDEFLSEMAEILEEDSVTPNDALDDFESWDSLAVLSVAALADAQFGVNMTAQEINECGTIEQLYQRIIAKRAA